MTEGGFNQIFQDSFETFKVFETLPYQIYGSTVKGHSKTIWQILNHLVIWQEFQLAQLNGGVNSNFVESESWMLQMSPKDENEVKLKIQEFKKQIGFLKSKSKTICTENTSQLKVLIESSNHLSFHLSEIILLARLEQKYPQADEMKAFLAKK